MPDARPAWQQLRAPAPIDHISERQRRVHAQPAARASSAYDSRSARLSDVSDAPGPGSATDSLEHRPPVRSGTTRGPVAVGVVLWAIFVARSAFTIDGRRYFTLFDDAMVSMRYAHNLAHGHGLVWNVGGQRVEGYTNFLWTLWMAVIHLLPFGTATTSLAVMLTGVVVLAATVILVHQLAIETAPDQPLVATIAAWSVALYYPLAFWTLRGMEVGVVTLALVAAAVLAIRLVREPRSLQAAVGLGLCLAVAVLTRDDAAVPAAVILLYVLVATPRRRLRTVSIPLLLALAAVAGHSGLRLWYYSQLLPNTYQLKIVHNPLAGRLERGLVSLASIGLNELALPVLLAGSYLLSRGRRRVSPELLLLVSLFLSVCAYSAYVGGDAWEGFEHANRYVCPAVPFLLVLAAFGITDLVSRQGLDLVRRCRWLAAGGAACAVLLALDVVPRSVIQDLQPDQGSHHLRIALLLLAAVGLFFLPRLSSRTERPRRAQPVVAFAVVAGLLVTVGGVPWGYWLGHNAAYLTTFDEARVRYGLAQSEVTRPDAVIAVAIAGAMPYFSQRPAVDLLGKSDPVIAKERPRLPDFFPGHNKYDYAYSICTLRPDLVVELWNATPSDRTLIEGCGYTRIRNDDVYVRDDTVKVDRVALEAAVARLERIAPTDF